mgnify:CR=1 FL=1
MKGFFTQSISRMVMASFVFVLLLPLGFIISYLNQHSWDIAKEELQDKHLLLADSMEAPILQYINTYNKALDVFLDSSKFAIDPDVRERSSENGFLNMKKWKKASRVT